MLTANLKKEHKKYPVIISDIDECADAQPGPCDTNAMCIDGTMPAGSFTCMCNAGYTGAGTPGNCMGK